MRFDIVVNPSGASGRTGRIFGQLVPIMKESGREIHIHFSTRQKGIETIVRELCRSHEKLNLIIIGGDGTWNEAVNGIEDFDKVKVGYIPAGSGNDFGKALGLPTNRTVLLRRILTGKVRRKLDVGEVVFTDPIPARQSSGRASAAVHAKTSASMDGMDAVTGSNVSASASSDVKAKASDSKVTRRFNVSCGMGFDAQICHEAAVSPMKGALNQLHLGKLVYILCAIELIFTTRQQPVKVVQIPARSQEPGKGGEPATTHKGQGRATIQTYPSCLFALAMNTKYEGGGFAFCPKARNDDGILDVCIGETRHKIMFFVAFPLIYSGSHTRLPVFHISQTGSVRFRAKKPLWVHTDGEVHYQSKDITIRLLPQKLQFLE